MSPKRPATASDTEVTPGKPAARHVSMKSASAISMAHTTRPTAPNADSKKRTKNFSSGEAGSSQYAVDAALSLRREQTRLGL